MTSTWCSVLPGEWPSWSPGQSSSKAPPARSASMRRFAPCTLASPAMPDVLQLVNITAGYGATVILEDVSVSLPHGAALAVLGRNGMGKTTLMRTIAGHADRHHGRVLLEGRDVGASRPWQRARLGVGYVPQERDIFPSLTVLENLSVGSRA